MSQDPPTVRIKIIRIDGKGVCTYDHKVGDVFEVAGNEQPVGLCAWAFNSIFPMLTVVRFGGSFPWEDREGEAVACCPDADNPVVFRITRDS